MSAKFSWMPEYLEPWGFNQAQVPEKESDHFDSLGFRGGVKTIGFLGAKGKRKGVELLLRAFSETSELHNSVLLLAGEHGRETRKLLTTKYSALVARRRIVSVDRFLSEEEFQNVFREIDLLCLPYRDHQAVSSIYLRAATLGKPTLASDKGWFSWAVPHYGHGEMVDVNSPGAFRESLLRFIKKPSQEHRITDQSEQILLENSPASVKDAWTALLRSRLSGSAF
ncbi:MAG: glycosyltransferase family 4 protein [Planctomycetes bacterium]|nr:glycosyltransferase family 4 protein [Planctomycetota bacterium]